MKKKIQIEEEAVGCIWRQGAVGGSVSCSRTPFKLPVYHLFFVVVGPIGT